MFVLSSECKIYSQTQSKATWLVKKMKCLIFALRILHTVQAFLALGKGIAIY